MCGLFALLLGVGVFLTLRQPDNTPGVFLPAIYGSLGLFTASWWLVAAITFTSERRQAASGQWLPSAGGQASSAGGLRCSSLIGRIQALIDCSEGRLGPPAPPPPPPRPRPPMGLAWPGLARQTCPKRAPPCFPPAVRGDQASDDGLPYGSDRNAVIAFSWLSAIDAFFVFVLVVHDRCDPLPGSSPLHSLEQPPPCRWRTHACTPCAAGRPGPQQRACLGVF
jgi:hypothetical protein